MTNSIGTANGKTAILWLVVGWSAFALLTGCATMQSADPEVPDNDPFESVNRPIYRANDFIDRRIAKPVTEAYVSYTPPTRPEQCLQFFR